MNTAYSHKRTQTQTLWHKAIQLNIMTFVWSILVLYVYDIVIAHYRHCMRVNVLHDRMIFLLGTYTRKHTHM